MRHFTTILSHEIRMLLVTPGTYVAAVLFLTVMGSLFTYQIDAYSKTPQEVSLAYNFFLTFFIPVLFMVPLLTMRCLAEERRLGTIETLLTTPVTTTEVVLGKYTACYLLYVTLWASTGGFFFITSKFTGGERLMESSALIGGYAFILVSGLLYIAVGIFASSLSRNQAVAGILGFALLFALILGSQSLASSRFLESDSLQGFRVVLEACQVQTHFSDFIRGIIDLRQILFYLSGTALVIILTILSVEARILHN